MKRALSLLVLLLAGCGEDEAPSSKKPVPAPPAVQALSEEDLDRFVDDAFLDEDAPEPGLSDDEIDEIVEDLLENP